MSENNVVGIIGAELMNATAIIGGTVSIGSFIVNDYVITIAEVDDGYGYTMTITKGTQTQTVTLYGLTPEQYESMVGYLQQAQEAAQSAAQSASNTHSYMDFALDAANRANTQAARAEQAKNTAQSYAQQAETAKRGADNSRSDAYAAKTAAEQAAAEAAASKAAAESAATRAETAAGEITGMTVEAETLEPGCQATASFLDGVLSLGIPAGANGAAGADGADGNGIVSIVKTGAQGNVDTYTITYTNGTTSTFTVTNGVDGAVTSVAGKTGTVTLNAGDVSFDDQQTYTEGTVGAGLANLKSQITSKLDATVVHIEGSENKFDKTAITQESFVNSANGAVSTISGYNASDFIPVESGETYTRTTYGGAMGYCAYYKSDKTYLSAGVNTGTFTVPANASFFRFTIPDGNVNETMIVKGNSLPGVYVPYVAPHDITQITDFENTFSDEAKEDLADYAIGQLVVDGELDENSTKPIQNKAVAEAINDLETKLDNIIETIPASANLFDKTAITAESYINSANGAVVGLSGYSVSDFIPVEAGETYTRTTYSGAMGYCAYYKSDKTYLSAGTNTGGFTAPANAAYFRFTSPNGNVAETMLVKGSVLPSEYVPYSPEKQIVQITDFEDGMTDGVKEDIADYVYDEKKDDLATYILGQTPFNNWRGKKVLCIGDSLTQWGTWYQKLTTLLGMDVSIRAKGGLNIEGFATYQQMVDGEGNVGPLSCADVYDKDLIVVFGGTNDRTSVLGTPVYSIGQVGDVWTGGSKTVAGCIQYFINHLYTLLEGDTTYAANPIARVVFITPYYVGKTDDYPYTGIEDYQGNGVSTLTIAQIMEKVCEYNGIPCYNSFQNSGINPHTWGSWCSNSVPAGGTLPDQLHLNSVGYAHLGECIAKWIATI